MAVSKKTIRNIVVLLVLAVILISGLYVYNVKMISDEEAKIADIRIPLETRKIKSSIDVVEKTNLRWKDAVTMRGWVCKVNVTKETREMYLVLKSKKNTFIYKIEQSNRPRPDVTAALHLDTNINNHGFALTFPLKDLKGDSYKLGFVVEDETGKYYTSANSLLTIPEDNDAPLKTEKGMEPKTISNQVALSVNEKTRELNYNFDKIDKSDEYITISGWAYLNGMDANENKTYIVLKKDKNVSVFDVHIRVRKDVTKVFIKDKLDLDSSGFMASIPVENLEKGKYQVGLYIANGNQSGLLYSNKFIDLGK